MGDEIKEGSGYYNDVANTVNGSKIKLINKTYPSTVHGILDSGSSGHFLTKDSPHKNARKQDRPLKIKQPDGKKLASENKCELKIYSQLSKEAREAYLFDKITFPLISVAKLCDNDCMVIFAKEMAFIIKMEEYSTKRQGTR